MPAPKKAAAKSAAKKSAPKAVRAPVVKTAINKSAVTGEIVSKQFAEKNPNTTFTQNIKRHVGGAALQAKQIAATGKPAPAKKAAASAKKTGAARPSLGNDHSFGNAAKKAAPAKKTSPVQAAKAELKVAQAKQRQAAANLKAVDREIAASKKTASTDTKSRGGSNRATAPAKKAAGGGARPQARSVARGAHTPRTAPAVATRAVAAEREVSLGGSLKAPASTHVDVPPPIGTVVAKTPSSNRGSVFNVEAVRDVLDRSSEAHATLRSSAAGLFGG